MNYAALLSAIDVANHEMRCRAAAVANSSLVIRNWLVGAYLVDFEQPAATGPGTASGCSSGWRATCEPPA